MRFLIDECLTLELVRVAEKGGYEAHHIAHLGKAGLKDWSVRDYAIDKDFVLVTNNASDFRELYGARDLHPGLVILVPNVPQEEQAMLFRAALTQLGKVGDLSNRLLEADIEGGNITVKLYDLAAG